MTDFRGALVERPVPIPLTVLTGAKGAGKTRLLNSLFARNELADTAVILNETGGTALRHGLVTQADDELVELGGGCVCCTARGAFTDALEQLLRALDNHRLPRLDRVIVETAGEADPAALIAALALHPYLSLRYAVDRVVAVIDSARGAELLSSDGPPARQVLLADLFVISGGEDGELPAKLNRLNPLARIVDPESEPASLFGPRPEAGEGQPGVSRRFLSADGGSTAPRRVGAFGLRTFSLEATERVARRQVDLLVDLLGTMVGAKLTRVAGTVAVREPDAVLGLQAAEGIFLPLVPLDAGEAPTRVRFVVESSEDKVAEIWNAAFGAVRPDSPDAAALHDNPLAIAGLELGRSTHG
jgi:G3E family GTPase